jgi:DNA-binding SARP family transcriptional activator
MIQQEASIAKITRPNLHNIYLREKFFGILDECREKPVIWITAPPGAGKTALISSYVESRNLECLWYQVDSGDRDPATFFHYIGVAATRADRKKQKKLPHLTPEYLLGLDVFARDYFSELYKTLNKRSLIVLDNYQDAPLESILHEVIHEGLSGIPEGINVVIISRDVPPPVLSRMRLSQLMEVITWDELRLTADEVRGITSMWGFKDKTGEETRELLAKSGGWAAGLVLMLGSEKQDCYSAATFDADNTDSVFNYFAREFLQKQSRDRQEFFLKSSVFPTMTSGMAEELIGNERAPQILAELAHKNYFIQSHPGEQTSYQYHPLFREFLYSLLKKKNSPESVAALEQRAAVLLAEGGHIDGAAILFKKSGDWGSLASLVCKEAPAMLVHGRHKTLEAWLNYFPVGFMEESPWLLYWKGCCHLLFDQANSRSSFEKAFEIFSKRKDATGVFLSWSGAIEAIIHEFDDLKPLDRWIDLLGDILKEHRSFPSREIEVRVSLCMFFALSFRAPQHPDIRHWVDKTYAFFDHIPDPNILVQTGLYLVDFFVWTGDLERANVIVEKLSKGASSKQYSPMALISTKLAEALNNWYRGHLDACRQSVSEGLKLAEAKGINVYNYFLYGHGAVSSMTGGDLAEAERFLKMAATVSDDNKRLCTSYYHHLAACHRLLNKDLAGALEHGTLALGLAVDIGYPFAEAMSRSGMALLYYELNERQRAFEEVAKAHELAVRTGSKIVEFISGLFEAYFTLDSGEKNLAAERLRAAMALGKRQGFVNFHMWRPDIISRLCVLCLEEGIEQQYVKRLIRERDLFPDEVPLAVENWPWRLKVHVLGQFKVIKDGMPLKFNRKVPKKPTDMLKLLISLGGRDVPEEKISDALWQDADGDTAHVAFTTTLKRLRSMIGVDDAILLSNGRLSLNPRYCWTDVWMFEDLIGKAKVYSAGEMDRTAIRLVEEAIEVYGSGFNVNLDEDPLEILFQERIRSKFIRSIIKLATYWDQAGEYEKAIECYKKGIEVEILSEELHQRLMVCLDKCGHRAEAMSQYNRLSKVFSKVLGIEPSSETKKIYKELSTGA